MASQAVQLVTSGTYQLDTNWASTQTWNMNATNPLASIDAGSDDILVSWVRYRGCYFDSTAPFGAYIACVRKETADSAPDISDADTIEKLKRDGKLFFFRPIWVGLDTPDGPRWLEMEFKNVALRAGESLTVYVRNAGPANTTTAYAWRILEYRKVTR